MMSEKFEGRSLKPHFNQYLFISLFFLVLVTANLASVGFLRTRNLNKLRVDIYPPEILTHFHFGYREILADLFWIRTIQDFDYCDSPAGKAPAGFILCSGNSWLYQQLNVVTMLSPDFRMPYATGGLALSVLITDIEGASKFFDKGVAAFPTDWRIHYRAAYHAMIEEKKPLKAAHLLTVAARNGGPQWIYALAGRMFVEGGAEELGLQLAQSLDGGDEYSQDYAKRIRERVKEHQQKK